MQSSEQVFLPTKSVPGTVLGVRHRSRLQGAHRPVIQVYNQHSTPTHRRPSRRRAPGSSERTRTAPARVRGVGSAQVNTEPGREAG